MLLAMMVAGSKFLVGHLRGTLEHWQAPTLAMICMTIIYAVMAYACWTARPWLRWLGPAAMLLVVMLALADLARNEVLDLATALVFLLATTVNMAVIGYTRLKS
jgi:hypothetical protein